MTVIKVHTQWSRRHKREQLTLPREDTTTEGGERYVEVSSEKQERPLWVPICFLMQDRKGVDYWEEIWRES